MCAGLGKRIGCPVGSSLYLAFGRISIEEVDVSIEGVPIEEVAGFCEDFFLFCASTFRRFLRSSGVAFILIYYPEIAGPGFWLLSVMASFAEFSIAVAIFKLSRTFPCAF